MADNTKNRIEEAATGMTHRFVLSIGPECCELPGPHFDFDRTFIRPAGMGALRDIALVMKSKPERKAGVWGHTDTVGDESYNKKLGDERAHIVFAALTHDPDPWEKRYQAEHWGVRSIQTMLNAVKPPDDPQADLEEDGVSGPLTQSAVKRFQEREGLSVDGVAGPITRKRLFLAYMKHFMKKPADSGQFVSIGGSPFMGCGEYNPFTEGVADDASRRVVVLLFGPKTTPSSLPCRLGDIGPCKSNLRDTSKAGPGVKTRHFRCKVYLGLARRCPCGPGVELIPFRVQIHDDLYHPCADTEYRLHLSSGGIVHGKTDDHGWLTNAIPRGRQDVKVTYTPEAAGRELSLPLRLTDADPASDEALLCHIFNIGFGAGTDDRGMLLKFQAAKGLPRSGQLDDATKDAVRKIIDGGHDSMVTELGD